MIACGIDRHSRGSDSKQPHNPEQVQFAERRDNGGDDAAPFIAQAFAEEIIQQEFGPRQR